jgi:histone H3/H4
MSDLVVVKAKIKDVAKDCNVAGDFAEALDKKARDLITDAVKRADENGRKTVMAKDVPHYYTATGKASEMLVVRSKIKEVAKDCNVAGDFADALNKVLNYAVAKAVERADGNSRKTVMAKDL